MKHATKKIPSYLRISVLVLVLFAVLSVFSIHILRVKLLQNAQEMGTYFTKNYSAEEQNNITIYQTLIELGTQYLDEQTARGSEPEKMQRWMDDLFSNITTMLGNQSVNLYAVIDGKLMSANAWPDMQTYDFRATDWYQQAIAAAGTPIFTNVYTDQITGKPVVTVAQKGTLTDNILVFDVFLENFHAYANHSVLPEGACYFLCDQTGVPLYYATDSDMSYTQALTYMQSIFPGIQDNSLAPYDANVTDLSGRAQGVYYSQMSNGWISVVTIPFNTILYELRRFITIFAIIFVLFVAGVAVLTVRDFRMNRKIKRVDDTARVLGNSYYAIYRIDYEHNTYEVIKSAPDVQPILGKQGQYDVLLHTIEQVVDAGTYQAFADSFSIQNIRKLVAEQVYDFGGDYLRRFGQLKKWVNVRLLFDAALPPSEVVLCFREVEQEKTEQLKQFALLKSALESAQKNEAAKTDFFNNMSHEMRTPLNAILGLSELARSHLDDSKKIATYLDKIQYSGRQLLDLINDLLEIAQLERGKLSFDCAPMDLQKCVTECTEIFQALAVREKKDFSVFFSLTDTMVMGNAARISQILNNLLSNAFKYSHAGASISISVNQCGAPPNANYQIIVSDTGIGISPEFLPHIFDSYSRETRFTTKNVIGTGLGMPIVKRLIDEMNGKISVQSQLGQGTTFTVTLPLTVTQPESPKDTPASVHFTLAGKRILLAEDNEINMEITKEILFMHDVVVTPVWNGKQAVQAFLDSEPFYFDAILMDMLMPEMNGCEATKAIRSSDRPDAKQIPILAVTANAFAEDIAMTTEAGMNAHIEKPIDFELLCQTLSHLIQNS